jgi:carboxyl-terminal processing protease
LRGKEKTSVLITVLSNHETKNVTVIRAIISVPLIEAHNLSTSHIITYKEVAFGTDKTLKNFLEKFIATGKKRLILDLRDNPGGSMLETRNILNFFIDKGNPLVMLKYQKKQNTYTSTLDRIVDWSQYEIIILVNKNTASAAEIIAAVLREYFPTNLIII